MLPVFVVDFAMSTTLTVHWPLDRVGETVGHSTVGYPDCIKQSGSRETQPSRENRDVIDDDFQTVTQM